MNAEIIKEPTTMGKTSDIASEQVLYWAKRVEAERAQKAMFTHSQEDREVPKIRHMKPHNENISNSQVVPSETMREVERPDPKQPG